MSRRPRAFVEAPAGLASVSLRLHGGERCRPPISRQGAKTGYAGVILGALGLRSGQGADAYVWAEADDDVRALLRAYPDPAMLRRIAEIIRGWSSEEPRALWERLRAERKARGARVDAEGSASWIVSSGWTRGDGALCVAPGANGDNVNPAVSLGGMIDRCHRLAEYATIAASNRLINMAGPEMMNTGNGGTRFGGEFATPPGDVADKFAAAADVAGFAWTTAVEHPGGGGFTGEFRSLGAAAQAHLGPTTCAKYVERYGRDEQGRPLSPQGSSREEVAGRFEEVAGWVVSATWAYRKGEPESGYNDAAVKMRPATATDHGSRGRTAADEASLVDRATVGGWPPVLVLPTIPEAADLAAMLGTPGDLDGVIVYSDPPYAGTTGYRHDLPRAEVVRFALDYAAIGAVVCVSEAEALPELVAAGWHVAEITAGRVGQRRTFSKQQQEWLTMNREPAHRVAVQRSLFGAA